MDISPRVNEHVQDRGDRHLTLGGAAGNLCLPERIGVVTTGGGKRKADAMDPLDSASDEESPLRKLKQLRIRKVPTAELCSQMRMQKDLDELARNPIEKLHVAMEKDPDDPLSIYIAVTLGLRRVVFQFLVPERYPFNAPRMRVCQELGVVHPMLDQDGTLNLPILQEGRWNPCNSLRQVLEELCDFLSC